jgi:hypothetical protein
MTKKASPILWIIWLAILASLIVAHIVIKQYKIEVIAEKVFAPPFVSVTDSEALYIGKEDHANRVRNTQLELKRWEKCVAENPDDEDSLSLKNEFNRVICRDRPEPVDDASDAQLIANGHRINRASFFQSEVAPRIKPTENYIDIAFACGYAVLAMILVFAFTRWLKFEGVPAMRQNLESMKESVPSLPPLPPLPNIKALNAGRKLRQAEKEFETLKNLHDNGLITDEMFLKRKAELKASLGGNEMFSKDDETPSSK